MSSQAILWMLAVMAVALISCVSPAALSVQNFGEMDFDLDVESERAQFNSTCKCGKKLTRIVGGNNTLVNEFPWQAALYIAATKKFMCGGSLITNQHILTAAHCFEALTAANMVVHLRAHNISDPSETSVVERFVKAVYIHKSYNSVTQNNDIAILHLNQTVD
ncbi:venom serine protease-like, partial [Hyalella azteca]|uniref:Venom serine protease-like n=1 Tax=Hyalella azteca TaxID=294128 RepID=A0A8B7P185_HYAAZ